MSEEPIRWMGSALRDLRSFPEHARRRGGFELHQVQLGLDPTDWRPMPGVGSGAREIRIRTFDEGASRAHRIFYVAKFQEAIYVLHAFEKKTGKTARKDIETGQARYRQVRYERRRMKGEE